MTGEMNSAQFGAIVGQVNLAHQPPMVRILFSYLSFFEVILSFLYLILTWLSWSSSLSLAKI